MAKKTEVGLKQTRGRFTVTGKITGVDRDNFYTEGSTQGGAEYARLNFGVRSSEMQTVFVSLFGMVPEKVYLFSTDRDLKYPDNMKQVDYETWQDEKEELEEDGWISTDLLIALERDSKGKLINQINTVKIDGIEAINEEELLYNGLDVTISGDLTHNTYQNRNGDEVSQTNYDVRRIYSTKNPIVFEDETFVERADFDQQFIYNDFDYDKKENKITIYGWSVNYQGKLTPVQFVIDPQGDEKIQQVVDSVRKKVLKYGQLCDVHGRIVNKALAVEEDNSDALGGLAGKRKQKITNYVRELVIEGFDEVAEGYSEDEILEALDNNTVIVKDEKPKNNGLSGKSKVVDDDDEDSFDIDDDDLPF